jgi:hypothetical protein
VPALVWYAKTTALNSPLGDYFDDFTTVLNDDNSIATGTPIAEFEINDETTPPPYPATT